MTYHLVPWNSMEHSMEFHGTLVPPNDISLCSMEFHGTLKLTFHGIYPGWTSKWYSMEFQGTLESSNKKSPSYMGFHGIKRAPLQMTQILHGISWNIPWNSMELWCRQMTYHLVPWNSMEHSMEFHGILVPPNEVSLSSMEYHGSLRSPFYGILPWLNFQGIFHGIPWNSGVAK